MADLDYFLGYCVANDVHVNFKEEVLVLAFGFVWGFYLVDESLQSF